MLPRTSPSEGGGEACPLADGIAVAIVAKELWRRAKLDGAKKKERGVDEREQQSRRRSIKVNARCIYARLRLISSGIRMTNPRAEGKEESAEEA